MQTQAHPVVIYSIIHASINIKVFLLFFFLLRGSFFPGQTDEEWDEEERFSDVTERLASNTKQLVFGNIPDS